MTTKTYRGSCHCKAVTFEADLDLSKGVNKCNCSICAKARSWFAIAKPDAVRVKAAPDAEAEYSWVPPGKPQSFLHFRFCKTCGIRTVGLAQEEGKEPQFRFVNVAALDGVDAHELAAAPVHVADGRHDRFDQQAVNVDLL